jgi:hypothetical protein
MREHLLLAAWLILILVLIVLTLKVVEKHPERFFREVPGKLGKP